MDIRLVPSYSAVDHLPALRPGVRLHTFWNWQELPRLRNQRHLHRVQRIALCACAPRASCDNDDRRHSPRANYTHDTNMAVLPKRIIKETERLMAEP